MIDLYNVTNLYYYSPKNVLLLRLLKYHHGLIHVDMLKIAQQLTIITVSNNNSKLISMCSGVEFKIRLKYLVSCNCLIISNKTLFLIMSIILLQIHIEI